MRDGVRLATEVYLPARPGHYPVVMQRTPYNRGATATGSNCDNASMQFFARNGYVALNQDVRGRYRSEGSFHPIVQEANDGYDAVEWAASQPWSTGKVGLASGSYVGLTQWQAAIKTPPHLAAIAPVVTASDYHDNWTYVNGAFDLWFAQSWTASSFVPDTYRRQLESQGLPQEEVDRRVADWVARTNANLLSNWVWQLPLKSFAEFRDTAPYYDEWLDHPNYDKYWVNVDVERNYSNVTVPTLNIGGWYDIFAVGTVRNFQGMRAEGGSRAARRHSQLIMRASAHAPAPGTPPTAAGEIDFGPDNRLDNNGVALQFFDRWLKGERTGRTEPAVKLFVMVPPDRSTSGSGFWITGDRFPLQGTRTMKLPLGSDGEANARQGDGVLGSLSGYRSPADSFAYDPSNPVPTVGGNLCCRGDLLAPGAFDQAEVELRDDVLVYTSAPLERDVTVIGSPHVKLWASSSAPDTDFTAKLVDVHHDGYAQNVLDRVVRARFRSGSKSQPSLLPRFQPYRYDIELGPTATVFKAGHRIRLEISSSNFPHFDRNPNTGHPFGQDAELRKATQIILHSGRRRSQLELPVVSSVKIP